MALPSLCEDQLMEHDLFRAAADAVHAAYPIHLIGSLERLAHVLAPRHLPDEQLQPFLTGALDFSAMLIQLFRKQQFRKHGWAMRLEILLPHPAPLANCR